MPIKGRYSRLDDEKLLTMQEAMEWLSERGYPCKSRSTFYRLLSEFHLQYTDVNPSGKNRIRRFPVEGLRKFISKQLSHSSASDSAPLR